MKSATGLAHGVGGILIVTMAMVANADTFYVNGSCGNDDWTGTNSVCAAPNGPKLTIQAGIDASVSGDTVIVADGTYIRFGNTDLDYGGRLITLRSRNGPAACIIDCENVNGAFHFHHDETDEAVVKGFTIRNGNGSAIRCESAAPTIMNCILTNNRSLRGGGLFNSGGNPRVTNCRFADNFASEGGGMYNIDSSPEVTDCTFSGNMAGSVGGGMYNWGSSPAVTNCTFTNNTDALQGGGMYNSRSSPTVTNCTFAKNTGVIFGGGMHNSNVSRPTVTNCTFSENSALVGGAMLNESGSSPTVTNCTFSRNSADSGGGMYNRSASGDAIVTNCILWNNGPDEIVDDDGAVTTVRFSDVRGGWPGEGNIDADPLIVDPNNGDYRLSAGSPCIDAADNTAVPKGIETDLDGNPRFVDDADTPDCQQLPGECGDPPVVDMGAYEFQGDCNPCDMNCDGDINSFDIEPFLALLFDPDAVPCSPCAGNTDGDPDGNINSFDIEPFLECLFGP